MADRHYLEAELFDRLRQDSSMLAFLFQGSLDGLWYWDLTDPEHEWMSPEFWTTLGWDPTEREHLAAEWQDLIHPDDLQAALAAFQAHKADPDVPYDLDVRYRDPEGHWRWVRCRGLILRDDQGTPVRMLGAHNDITRLKETEQRLRIRTRELEEANAELRAASHDLKAPLRRIRMFAQLLQEDLGPALDGPAAEDMTSLITATEQMHSVISAVLRLAEAGGSELQISDVSLAETVDSVLIELDHQLRAIGGQVDVSALPTVQGDAVWLRRVLQNLLDNAVNYRHPDRPLEVEIGYDPARNALFVRDNGLGIAAEHLEEVFIPFRRLHSGAEGAPAGHGLGLALCRRVAQRHGGSLVAESDGSTGTTLWLGFPQEPG